MQKEYKYFMCGIENVKVLSQKVNTQPNKTSL